MFWYDVKRMDDSTDPLFTITPQCDGKIWPEHLLTLTDTGSETLAGRKNHLNTFTGTRWVGGVKFAPRQA